MNDSAGADLRPHSVEADADAEVQGEFSERRELLLSFLWLFIPVSIVLKADGSRIVWRVSGSEEPFDVK
ncbi:MAG: hypothetical protein B6D71_05365, partial [gamma proteobacterium symbiont of Stewartia floridana]